MPHGERWLIAHNQNTAERRCRYISNYSDGAETDFKRAIENLWGVNVPVAYSSKSVAPKYPIEEI